MKSGIGAVLLILGFGLLVVPSFFGPKVSAADEWDDAKVEKFSQITANVHSPQRDPDAAKAEIEELQRMQQEIVDFKDRSESKHKMYRIAGLLSSVVGLSLLVWALTDEKNSKR